MRTLHKRARESFKPDWAITIGNWLHIFWISKPQYLLYLISSLLYEPFVLAKSVISILSPLKLMNAHTGCTFYFFKNIFATWNDLFTIFHSLCILYDQVYNLASQSSPKQLAVSFRCLVPSGNWPVWYLFDFFSPLPNLIPLPEGFLNFLEGD